MKKTNATKNDQPRTAAEERPDGPPGKATDRVATDAREGLRRLESLTKAVLEAGRVLHD